MKNFATAMRVLHREYQKALHDAAFWKARYEALEAHYRLLEMENIELQEQEERNRE